MHPGAGAAPVLSFPPEEEAALRAVYGAAQVILEYGSGGSTVLAAGLAGRQVFSVESDAAWHQGMQAWFAAHPPLADLVLHHADIGPTGPWGAPAGIEAWARFHSYPLSVWERADFTPPDTVLIDGRFRTACFLAVALMTVRPVTVLWDDYRDRPEYHVVERLAQPVAMHGRMARFDLTPMTMAGRDLPMIVEQFTRIR
ncbi:MAG: hypothetical protein IT542_01125 [Rubellimicrobium sp.]|nr:hypothetical protein [Rubellimicrobium sp.]